MINFLQYPRINSIMTYNRNIWFFIINTLLELMYSSYGSSMGGYGSYGSSYGGYGGGYGSSYGGGYGSSYGSYGLNRASTLNAQNLNQQNIQDPNQAPQAEINNRKVVFEQYFKMMGGLRSMVEIGFSLVALCNFTSRSWQLLKKIITFLGKTSKKLFYKLSGAHYLTDKMSQAFQKALMLSPNSKNGSTIVNKVLLGLRITAAIFILIGYKLRNNLNKQVENQHDELVKKYEEVKLEEVRLLEKQREEEQYGYERINQKQGYF